MPHMKNNNNKKKLYSFASWQIFNWTQFSCANEAGEELSYLDVNTDKKNFGFYTKHLVRWINPQKVNSPNNRMHCWMYRQWEFKRIINKEILFGINTKFSEPINRAIYWHHLGEITFRYNELKNGPPAVKKSEEARNQLTIKSIISHWPKGFWCWSSCVQHGTYLSIL